jgi:NAD(P)-dependent dehydrogenase (short-subunit alcohol dehydrogenase family)
MRHFEGKTAVVTGGSRRFGQGIVRALVVEGAAVWALARQALRGIS